MQSYNHPAWQYPRPPHHATSLDGSLQEFGNPPRPRHTSMSSPSSPCMSLQATANLAQSSIPPSLTPGRQQRARVWDKSPTQRPRTSHGALASPYLFPKPSLLYGDYFSSQPQSSLPSPPPLPQKPHALFQPLTNPLPPIPPKPPALAIPPASRIPLYPVSIPLTMATPHSQSTEPIPPPDEREVEIALALSASETRRHEQELNAQEEEELARVLEESRLLSSTTYTLDEQLSSPSTPLKPPSLDRLSICAIKASTHPPEGESWLHMITPTPSTSSQNSCLNEDLSSLHSSMSRDESSNDPGDYSKRILNGVQDPCMAPDTLAPTPPLYANVVSNLVRNPLPAPSSSQQTAPLSLPLATSVAYLQNDRTLSSDRIPTSPSLTLSSRSSSSEQWPMPSFTSRPSWTSVSSENSSSLGHSLNSDLLCASSGYKSPTHPSTSPDLSTAPLASSTDEGVEEEAEREPGPSTRTAVPLSANQYVERDMLLGVSLGFTLPVISTELILMAGAMPNVITLPYGKAPVFHFQAPSWRKLLKLMARLSATRVEPTVDAISVAKHSLRLRTVIQFVKIHHSASEWRTVLYLTTDYPIPPNLHNSHKYTNGDVSILPYSYTLSPLPTLLRDGAESPMAKYYVVPSTSTTPYPNLPINFPNLAMYLQSAVQDSRRAANDSSSGLRKLAQYIDNCYHTEAERVAPVIDRVVPRRGVGGMIKRVMGRHRTDKSGGGNEEIYDLVTPFVSDEWG